MNPFGSPPRRNPPPSPKKDGGEVLKCEFYDSALGSNTNKKLSNLTTEICGETLSSGKAHCYGLWLKSNVSKRYVIQKKGCWINDAQCRSNPKCYPIHSNRQAAESHVFCCCHGNECNAGDRLVQNFYSKSSIPPPLSSSNSKVENNDYLKVVDTTVIPPHATHYNSGFIQSPQYPTPPPTPYYDVNNNNFFASILASAMSSPSSRTLLIAAMTAVPLCLVVLILFAIFFAYNYRSKRAKDRSRKGGPTKAVPGLDTARHSKVYDIKPSGYENRIYPNARAYPANSRPVSAIGNFACYGGEWDRLIEHPNSLTPLKHDSSPIQSRALLPKISANGDSKNGKKQNFFRWWAFFPFTKLRSRNALKLSLPRPEASNNSVSGLKSHSTEPGVDYKLLRLIATSPVSRVYLAQRNIPARPKLLAAAAAQLTFDLSLGSPEKSADLAVKIYPPDQREGWDRELEVYRYLAIHNHPHAHANVLPLVDALIQTVDEERINRDSGIPESNPDLLIVITPPSTLTSRRGVRTQPNKTEYWLVTEYQENGSLLDYLKFNTIGWDVLISIALGISLGLAYLHSNCAFEPANNGVGEHKVYKPAVAHKDLKSKNVFLNRDLTARIGDFGAAVVLTSVAKIKQSQGQRGTLRYMAPEILEGAISFSQDCFLKIDVYAFALILWELMSRCHDINSYITQYKMPYEDELSCSTTLEEMQDLICTRNVRPKIPEEWTKNKLCADLVSTVKDCWERDPEARISAITLHERIKEIAAKIRHEPQTLGASLT